MMTQWPLTPLPPGAYTVVVLDDTTVEVSEGPFAGRTLKVPAFNPLPKELRKAVVHVGLEKLDADRVINRVYQRPQEPPSGQQVRYRGWECGYDADRGFWTPEGYAAYKGGVDLDAPQVHASTWDGLLEAIDDEEDE